ncbi:MAG TPA: hypothetical protein PLT50_04415, partial [bacterium]|nr:hypothetical protein [bacterium]
MKTTIKVQRQGVKKPSSSWSTTSWVAILGLISVIASLATLPPINPIGVTPENQTGAVQVPTSYAPTPVRDAPTLPQGFGFAVMPEVARYSDELVTMIANPPPLFQGLERPQVEGQHQADLLWILSMGGNSNALAQELNWWQIATQG